MKVDPFPVAIIFFFLSHDRHQCLAAAPLGRQPPCSCTSRTSCCIVRRSCRASKVRGGCARANFWCCQAAARLIQSRAHYPHASGPPAAERAGPSAPLRRLSAPWTAKVAPVDSSSSNSQARTFHRYGTTPNLSHSGPNPITNHTSSNSDSPLSIFSSSFFSNSKTGRSWGCWSRAKLSPATARCAAWPHGAVRQKAAWRACASRNHCTNFPIFLCSGAECGDGTAATARLCLASLSDLAGPGAARF